MFVSESEAAHDASKFLGGTGVSILAGGGLGRLAGAAGTGAAGAQTARMVVQANGQLAAVATTARAAITPAAAGVVAGAGVDAIGQTVLMATPKPGPVDVEISKSRHPESAEHIEDAQAAGYPSELTIDRPGAPGNRAEALDGIPKIPGKQLDEYPPAMFKEGGAGASVRPIDPSDNLGAGAVIGNRLRGVPNGAKVRIKVVP